MTLESNRLHSKGDLMILHLYKAHLGLENKVWYFSYSQHH